MSQYPQPMQQPQHGMNIIHHHQQQSQPATVNPQSSHPSRPAAVTGSTASGSATPVGTTTLQALTTEEIQQRLDENQQLIFAVLEHQQNGRYAESSRLQTHLHQNLLFLATHADAQMNANQVSNSNSNNNNNNNNNSSSSH